MLVLRKLRQYLLAQLQRHFAAPRTVPAQTPYTLGLSAQSHQLTTVNGKRLSVWLLPGVGDGEVDQGNSPAGAPRAAPTLILLHGWGGNRGDLLPLAAHLQARGYTSVLLDARGHGDSDDEATVSLPRFAEDLATVVDWAQTRPEVDARRLGLIGHSVGAGAALLLASRRQDLAAVVSLAAFAHPGRLMRQRLAAHKLPYWPLGWYALRLVEQHIGVRLDAIAPENTIRRSCCPVLLVHGSEDDTVPVSDARHLQDCSQAGRHPARLVLLAGDHGQCSDWDAGLAALETFLSAALRCGGVAAARSGPDAGVRPTQIKPNQATGASIGCSSPD